MAEAILQKRQSSLSAVDWTTVQELLKALRTHRALDRSTTAVMYGFQLLDRLAEECNDDDDDPTSTTTKAANSSRENNYDNRHEPAATVPLDLRALGAVLAAWKRLLRKGCTDPYHTPHDETATVIVPYTPPQVLQKVEFYRQVGLFEPNAVTYTVLMDSLKLIMPPPGTKQQRHHHHHRPEEVRLLAQEASHWGQVIWDRMMADCGGGDPFDTDFHPTRTTVLNLLALWTRSGEPAVRAERIVRQLLAAYDATRRVDCQPTVRLYVALAQAHVAAASSSSSTVTQDVVRLTREVWEAIQRGRVPFDLVALNILLHMLAKTKDTTAADTAATILQQLLDGYPPRRHPQEESRSPNQSTFVAVISALGRTGQVERAEAVLQTMEDLYYTTSDPAVRPNKACYGALVWAYVKAGGGEGDKTAKQQAEATVLRMSNMCNLDHDSWNGILASWTQSGDDDAAERTAAVIQWLEKEIHSDDAASQPPNTSTESTTTSSKSLHITTYNSLLGSYARSKNPQQGARLASDLFQWMQEHRDEKLHPNAITYLAIITAWRNARNPAQADSMLRLACEKIRKDSSATLPLDERHFNICLSAWAESSDPEALKKAESLLDEMESVGLVPDIVTYNSLLKVISRHAHPKVAARRCLSILRETQRLNRSGLLSQGPDIISYNTTIAAVARSGDSRKMKQAVDLFQEMTNRGVKPDRATYNTIMSMYAKNDEPEKVQQVFQSMEKAADAGTSGLRPDFKSYTILLQAWASAGKPKAALQTLENMIEGYDNGQLREQPNTRDFNAILQAWRRSDQACAATESVKALRNMEKLASTCKIDCSPDRVSWNTVIGTLTKMQDWPEALCLLREMKSKGKTQQPDLLTYSYVLEAVLLDMTSRRNLTTAKEILNEMAQMKSEFWKSKRTPLGLSRVCKHLVTNQGIETDDVLEKLVQLMREHNLPLDTETSGIVDEWKTNRTIVSS